MPCQRLSIYVRSVSFPAIERGRQFHIIGITVNKTTQTVESAATGGAFHIEDVFPLIDGGRFPVKRIVGERVEVWADIYRDGHDVVSAALVWRRERDREWHREPMTHHSNDRWSGSFVPDQPGHYVYAIEAWTDEFATWRHGFELKQKAGTDVALDAIEGAGMLTKAQTGGHAAVAVILRQCEDFLQTGEAAPLLTDELKDAMAESQLRPDLTRSPLFPLMVDRPRARAGAWYEMVPRSQGKTPGQHGTFKDCIARLPDIAVMGFDVVYLTPIHPIGSTNRKGRNNAVTAAEGDPGSPYAIGSAEGGHDAVHPELGTLEEFREFVAACKQHEMEVALDFAIQCSPDHPWLKDHPQWFRRRPDGSMRYAENPPKKYEDIVNPDFSSQDAGALWNALRDVVLFWIEQGVKIFRVDNPHTKPFRFWEWLIHGVQLRHPDVIFLAEAFTRPKLMKSLGELAVARARSPVTPAQLAYVLFTSGSTGHPKGVMVTQRALVNELQASTRRLATLAADDGFLQLASFTFDQSVHEILWPLVSGARLVLIGDGDQRDPARLIDHVRRARVTILDAVPTMLRALVAEPGFAGCRDLRLIVSGGEALPTDLVRAIAAVHDVPIENGYGPTESAITVCYARCTADAPIVLGAPWSNVRFHVLDAFLEPVGLGIAGELYIAGRQLARGYRGRPDLTAERFVPDPSAAGERMYRTGDRVRWFPDGTLEFLGRVDEQVKIRGARIELGEIEAALRGHDAIVTCAVIVTPGARGDELVAYVVARSSVEPAALRAYLADRLPEYMVPVTYVRLDALPLTSSGKLDRRALPAPSAVPERDAVDAPENELEAKLVEIWIEVLGVTPISRDDDFFALGGHSLLATQVMSRVRAAFDVPITVQHLFDASTIADLAVEIARLRAEAKPAVTTPPPVTPATGDLSYAQQRLWLVYEATPDSNAYHMPIGRRIRGSLDPEALRGAFEDVVRRHEILRTRFPASGGVPRQEVQPMTRWELPVDDLGQLAPTERERALEDISRDDVDRPFDLAAGPVLRTRLVRLAPDEHVVLVTVHHIVFDGWSVDVFWRELAARYDAHHRGEPLALPPLPLQYASFAAEQRARISSEELERQLAYWKRQLAGAPDGVALPKRGVDAPPDNSEIVVELAAPAAEAVRALGRREGTTLFMALIAAFRAALARTTGQTDLVIGTPVANRYREDLEGLIGMFVNTVVLRAEVAPHATFGELVRRERETMLAAHAHQDVPFESIVHELGVARSPNRNPIFQIWFVQENVLEQQPPFDRAFVEEDFRRGLVTNKFDLAVYVNEVGDRIELAFIFDAALFDREVIAGLARRSIRALELGARTPDRALDEADFGDPPADSKLDVAITRPSYPPVLAVIEELATREPERAAVRYAERTTSYGELWSAAGRIAHSLADAGIVAGDRVALTGPPSFGLLAGFLGILRSGACFVPLSARLSRDHVEHLLELVDARLVLQVGAPSLTRVPVASIDPHTAGVMTPATPAPRTRSGDPAIRYIYFTSGTTGAQKGVVGDLEPLAHFTAWQRATFGELAGPVCAQLTDLGFDVFLRETMFALTSGRVVTVPPSSIADLEAADLLRWLERERVTAIHTVPSLARMWTTEAPPDVKLAELRCVFVVGEPLDATVVERWRQRFRSDVEFINLYGTTETGPAKAWYRVAHPAEPGIQPIGRALPETQLVLVRDDKRPCAAGEVGELVIRTPFSTRGYLDADARGAFYPNPFRADPSDVLYRTGDLGRRRPDGAIEILGRVDDQVKLRGQRVDPPGIAAALCVHPGVNDAAVIAVRSGADVQLVAYVVRAKQVPASELRELLGKTVPAYMIPAGFVFLDTLPKKPNGKLDRDALPAPDWNADDGPTFTAPRNPEEEAIAAIWCEVLRIARVGVRDDFFALGGHSLHLLQVASRVRAVFGVQIAFQSLFALRTVEGIAAEIIRARVGSRPALPIVRIDRTGDLPLSFAQQRMWFLHQLAPTSAAYHMSFGRRLRGSLATEALRRAFDDVVRRHESLRTVFPVRDGTPFQQIRPPQRWELAVDDLSQLAEVQREAAIEQRVRDEAERPFSLATGPLLRTRVLRLAPDDHVLLVTLHHIISDAWSMGVFWGEISELYRAHTTGTPPRLPALPIQNADFAAWQRASLANEALDEHLGYWKTKLADAPERTELPLSRPRPAIATARGARHTIELGGDLIAPIRALGASTGATQFMILLAAFRAALSRITGQTDLCIGAPIANRGRKEVEHVIGFMLNTLVLRTPVEPRQTFAELVRLERTTALEAYAHQEAPFEMIVDALAIERSLDRTPLYQVSFVHQTMPQQILPIGELVDGELARDELTTRFDLSVFSFEYDRKLSFELVYNRDLFDRDQIEQIAASFTHFLRAAIGNPQQAISRIPMIDAAQRDRVLVEWNRTAGETVEATIPALFDAQVDRTPDATALVLGTRRLSYRELELSANRIAHALAEHGVGPEVVVGIALERSFELVAAILGVGKAGGAWVPLDPKLPSLRLEYMATVARPRVVITSAALVAGLPPLGIPVVVVDGGVLDRAPATRPSIAVSGDHLAYVLFTSGSTGRPKGVMISHAGIVNELVSAQALRAQLDSTDAFLQLAPYTFDLSIHEILWPLSVGARVVLLPEGDHRDPRRIVEEIRAREVTILHPVPTLLRALLAHPDFDHCTSLRTVVSGGEAMPLDVLRAFMSRRAAPALVNSYGPTETSVTVSQWRARADATAVAIGTPWIATQLHVLDGDLEPVPIGIVGELFIGGRQVGRGYAGQPALTAERFVPDPFVAGARLFRTGDRAKRWPDGNIELLGRGDSQIKLRGFRIELNEIVATLREHAGAREAVVTVVGEGVEARLVAYIVADASWSSDATRAVLAARLPEYMVPKIFVRLDALPLLPNGKIDRAALRVPDDAALEREDFEAPATPLEEVIAGLWAELLHVDPIGRRDNFFSLGGHSLLAARLAWELNVPVATVFTAPTIAGLASAIEASERGEILPPIVPIEHGGELELSYAQQRMWFLQQLAPTSSAYHIAVGRRLRGVLDVEALRAAIEDLVARHAVLRTTFPAPAGTPSQRVHDPVPWILPFHDLTATSLTSGATFDKIAGDVTERPFDLATELPLRTALVKRAPDDHVLLITLHHIAADGWSIGVLWTELEALYVARTGHRPAQLAPLPVQYADYATWQRRWVTGPILDEQLAYWKGRLHGAPEETELPLKGPRPPVQTYRGAAATVRLDRRLTDELRELGRRHGTTLFITMLAAFRALLHRYTGQDDICIGAPNANRSARNTDSMIGLFLNTLVLRTPARGTTTFAELLTAERTTALEAFAHADAPFEMVVEALGVARSLARNPVFQVLFQVQFADGSDGKRFGELAATSIEREEISTQVDLDVSALVDRDGIELVFVYNIDLFATTTIANLGRHFRTLVAAAVAAPDTPLAELAMLSLDERDQLIEAPNRTAYATPDRALPALLVERAHHTPDAIAVVSNDIALSYRQLIARSSQLAHHLRARGLAPEERVGICLERDCDLVVALLGVLLAGGAYVPLDAELPAARLAYMAQDAGVRTVITCAALRDRVPAETIVELDTVPLAGEPADPPDVELAPERLAYVLYTSGSTGRPKAVQVQHGSLINFLASMRDGLELTARDTLLAITTASFDISGLELYLPLLAGGRVVVASRDDARDGTRIRALLETTNATVLQATPAAWRNVLDAAWPGRAGFVALCGGEAMPPELASALAPNVGALWNLYGPTETTIWSARKRIRDGVPIRLGEPIANTRLYVLDPVSFEVQPFEVAGELFIAGSGLARGYGGQPGLTAERFLPDPFGPSGARMYRTGDRVRRRSDGELEFLGRIDHQIKLRGFRIEPAEIEAVLGEHPAVADVVVVVRDERLVAYVVAIGTVTVDELLGRARVQLPEYMVPTSVMILDEMPLSPAGKIDRRALPAPSFESAHEYIAPQTDVEVALVAVWQQVLGRTHIGIGDNFFDLGGHSLMAIRLLWEINRVFDATIPLRQIFSTPTIQQFAALPTLTSGPRRDRGQVVLEATGSMRCAVTALQRANHDIHRDDPTNAFVHMAVGLDLTGPLDRSAMHRALTALTRMHSILRTTFRELGGSLVQIVTPADEVPDVRLDVLELPLLTEAERDAACSPFLTELRARPFDLAVEQPVRGGLVVLAPDHHILALIIHHMCSDGPSLRVVISDLVQLYLSEAGLARAVPPSALEFIDFAEYTNRHAASPRGLAQHAYWEQQLAGAPAPVIPSAGDRSAVDRQRAARPRGMATFETHWVTNSIDATTVARLHELARETDATLMITLLAGFAATLHGLTDQTDICIQSTFSQRHDAALERTIGPVANPVILRIGVDGRPTFRTLVERTQHVVFDAFEHGLSPVIDWVPPGLRRINFNFNPLGARADELAEIAPGLRMSEVAVPLENAKTPFDLHLWLHERADSVSLHMLGNRELLDRASCERLLARYAELLGRLAGDPDS